MARNSELTEHGESIDWWRGRVDGKMESIERNLLTLSTHLETLVSEIKQETQMAHSSIDIRLRTLEDWRMWAIGFAAAVSLAVSIIYQRFIAHS